MYIEKQQEIKNIVEKLYDFQTKKLKIKENKYGSNQNKKIVAWMLNRKKHLNEKERLAFFKRLNPHSTRNENDLQFESDYNIGEDEKLIISTKKAGDLLDPNHEEENEENNNQFIQTIQFEFPFQLKSFLKSLFQLKPILISSYSVDKFRIVIENYAATKNINYLSSGANYTSKWITVI